MKRLKPDCWTVTHSTWPGAEGLLESRSRARIQKRLLDEDEGSECRHTIVAVYNIRLITANEISA